MDRQFLKKLVELGSNISTDSKDSPLNMFNSLSSDARNNNFPAYSLLLLIYNDTKVDTSSRQLSGWVAEKGTETKIDNKLTIDNNLNEKKNNSKYLVALIIAIVVITIGIVIYKQLDNNGINNKAENGINEELAFRKAIEQNTLNSLNLYKELFPYGKHIFSIDSAIYVLKSKQEGTVEINAKIDIVPNLVENLNIGSSAILNVSVEPYNESIKISCNNNNISYNLDNDKITITGNHIGTSELRVYQKSNPTNYEVCYIDVVKQPDGGDTETVKANPTIGLVKTITTLKIGESIPLDYIIKPFNTNSFLSLAMENTNKEILEITGNITSNSAKGRIYVKGKKIGKSKFWFKLIDNEGNEILSKKYNIMVNTNIESIYIKDKEKYRKSFIVGEFLPDISIGYSPWNSIPKDFYYKLTNTSVIRHVSYNNKFEVIGAGECNIYVISKANEDIYDLIKVNAIIKTPEPPKEDDKIYTIVDVLPSYVGGQSKYAKFIKDNIRYPERAKENGTEGKVYVSFVVEKDGRLTYIKIDRGIGDGCDDEAIRIISMMPNWNPGRINNKIVRTQHRIFIPFSLY